jgi:hypothetical protein
MSTTIKTIYGSDMRRFTVEETAPVGAFLSLVKTIGTYLLTVFDVCYNMIMTCYVMI